MPKRPIHAGKKLARATVAALTSRKNAVVKVAQGTLLAVGITLSQVDAEQAFFDKKFFEPGVLDRLHEPMTRYHE